MIVGEKENVVMEDMRERKVGGTLYLSFGEDALRNCLYR